MPNRPPGPHDDCQPKRYACHSKKMREIVISHTRNHDS